MSNRSVCVLSSSGCKVGYKTYRLAMADVDSGLAILESARCIRLLPTSEGVEWRTRRSGHHGPIVRQMERLLTAQEVGKKERR